MDVSLLAPTDPLSSIAEQQRPIVNKTTEVAQQLAKDNIMLSQQEMISKFVTYFVFYSVANCIICIEPVLNNVAT